MEENQAEKVEEIPQELPSEELKEESQTQKIEEKPEKTAAEINWEQANYALKMQRERIAELEKRIAEQQQVNQEPENDEFSELDPKELISVEKATKLVEKKARHEARQIVQEYMQQQALQMDEQRMRSTHEDYDYVLENYAIPLIKNDPALAHKIQTSKNPAETAYRLGKLADNFQEPMVAKENKQKAEKIIKNSTRPVSGNALGAPLKSQAEQLTKMSSQQIWEMSQKYARGG